ncbi:metallophosphoesterase family protein [Phocaeicola abscessus]|uniref:metallophosphoesterase family protein n=1 Tax=Phocaeicola abscessus TaxID=555313 RepID=UPI0028E621BC|nr:metallophosphoesterase family protein [Phocaeicola abscessus]
MNRRTFLKNSALMGLTGIAASFPERIRASASRVNTTVEATKNFRFDSRGKFKILQFTDTHYISGDPRSEQALRNVCEILDLEKPDAVIHTGDIIFGEPAEASLREILSPMSERKIPFAVALGNHDGQFDKNRKEVFEIVKTIPYNINKGVEGIYGDSNDLFTVNSSDGKTHYVLYLFDSGDTCSDPDMQGYDYIHFDQIEWYRKQSETFRYRNNDKPLPALAFFHIPVPEFTYALRYETHRIFKGNLGEDPCPPNVNSGLFVSMKEMGDVKAIICGHDHNNDYAMKWRGMFLIYGRFSGCDTVYNDLKPNGARLFELTEGEEGFRSWIRLSDGEVTQDLLFPDAYRTY